MIQTALAIFALIVAFVAMIYDFKTMRIPNWLTLPTIIIGLVCTYIVDWQTGLISTGFILGFFVIGAFGVFGLGDLKLVMALIATIGFLGAIISVTIASIALVYHKVKRQLYIPKMKRLKKDSEDVGLKVPFAPYIFVGYVMYFAADIINLNQYF